MQKYTVTGTVFHLSQGLVELTDKQAEARAYAVKPTDQPGIYEILKPIQFKKGEVVGYDDDVPKTSLSDIKAVGGEKKPETLQVDNPDPPLPPPGDGGSDETPGLDLSDLTVRDLAEAQAKTVAVVLAHLKEAYDFEAKNGKTVLPEELITKLVEAGEIELTLDPEDADAEA